MEIIKDILVIYFFGCVVDFLIMFITSLIGQGFNNFKAIFLRSFKLCFLWVFTLIYTIKYIIIIERIEEEEEGEEE